jgi:hypothetical protein
LHGGQYSLPAGPVQNARLTSLVSRTFASGKKHFAVATFPYNWYDDHYTSRTFASDWKHFAIATFL